jgi:hemerythrin superfamily protein
MNANDLLMQDHRELEDAYTDFVGAEGRERDELAKQILTDLTVHAVIEEEFYYPALEEAGEKALADEYRAEHAGVKVYIGKLSMMDVQSDEYEPTMKAMMESVMHHVAEEESTALPRMESIIGTERLEEMVPAMEERKAELRESTLKRLFAAIT